MALVFAGLFFSTMYGVNRFADPSLAPLILVFLAIFVLFPISYLGGYFLARPLQKRLMGKETLGSKAHTLNGMEKPHGVFEDRNINHYSGD